MIRRWIRFLVPMLAATTLVTPAFAQRAQSETGNEPELIVGGLLSGAAGMFMGGYAGASLMCDRPNRDEWCGLIGFVWGGAVGESLMLPLGVHLTNGRRGNLALSTAASAGIAALGILAVYATGDARPLLVVPLVQLAATITIEHATARPEPPR